MQPVDLMLARPPRILLFVLLLIAFCAPAGSAGASPNAGYAVESWAGCGAGYNSGGWDDAGRTYVPCGSPTTVGVYSPSGELVESVPLGVGSTDVAPTADGQYLYAATGSGPRRYARGSNGTFTRDTTWSPARYPMYGSTYALGGLNVAVDGAGNSYWSDGAWASNGTHTVIKYAPNGTYVTRFGEYSNNWNTGTFYWMLTGLSVTRDGGTVLTTEVGNNRVQTWTRGSGGSYAATSSFGGNSSNNPTREGFCQADGWVGKFAAPYDVGVDRAGNIYVINTTCKQVLKFSPGFGTLLANVDIKLNGGDYPRPHGFTVAADGTVYIGENAKVLRLGSARPSAGGPPASSSGAPGSGALPGVTPPAGTGSITPPAGAGTGTAITAPDTAAPRIAFALAQRAPRPARNGWGVPVRVRCSENCRVRVRLVLRIGAGLHSRTMSFAETRSRLAGGTMTPLSVRLTPLGYRSLGRASRHRAVAIITATDARGNTRTIERRVSLLGSPHLR